MRKYVTLVIIIFLFFFIGLAQEQQIKYAFLFVPNSGGGNSISEVNITDPSNPREVSRHWTVPTGWYGNPSRTAIDHYGNAWVGNRATNTLVKVGNLGQGTCIDKNNDGRITTSKDTSGNGVIDDVEMVSFENDECILKNIALPSDVLIAHTGCDGCHCSGTGSGTFDMTSYITEKKTYTLRVWCTEAGGVENCQFRIRLDMPDGTIRYISKNGDYGDISVSASYGTDTACSGINGPITTDYGTHDWYSEDLWSPCDYCDFYAKVDINVKNVDWGAIWLEMNSDDGGWAWLLNAQVPTSLPDGAGVRAVCIDANDNVYAGLFSDMKLFYISKEGEVLKKIDLAPYGCRPYGCTVDKNGYVWVSCVHDYKLVKYDPKTEHIDSYYEGMYVYGLTPTKAGDGVIFNAWENSKLRKVGLDGSEIWTVDGPYQGRGVTVDKDDNIYAVGSYYNELRKYDKNGNLLKTATTCSQPTGVGLDVYGNVWVACYSDNCVARHNSTDLSLLNKFCFGTGHYVYSDWTGYILTVIVAPTTTTLPPPINITGVSDLITFFFTPFFFLVVLSLAVAVKVESMVKSNGYAFLLTFFGLILLFTIFSGYIPVWFFILILIITIGGFILLGRR